MKKFRMVIVIALALVFFSGCKKQTQKEFTAELEKQREMNAGNYAVVIDQLAIKSATDNASQRASMEMAAKMISGTKISGNYLKDSKKKLWTMTADLELLGQTIPLEFFMDQKKQSVYLDTVILTKLTEIAKEFDAQVPIKAKDLEALKGKYIHITKDDLEEQRKKQPTTALSGNFDSKLFSEYLETLDADSFEKKGDTIKRTFTKKDIQGFVSYVKEHGDQDEQQTAKELAKNSDQLTKYKQTILMNLKKHTQKTTLAITAEDEGTTVTLGLTLTNQAKNSKKTIQLPKKVDTVSIEKLSEIIASGQAQESLISEAEFNELLAVIESSQTQLTQPQIDQIKETYKPYLTDQQYKQLEKVLERSSQIAA
ncbi:hypothetical protein P7D52_12660 [Enterococcus dongliensis]|uniref:Lipoprotein n=3 Tax=Enterococcus dongliensis TaxID=2559925 RepID=A0AAP5U1M5_9ENTE|nr:hypothetical protein [Enterococcus dongliensis]MDT2597962.1 hypothetical protein [Enterococcus dongliensis]MDT2635798.1 hypothetical protein [Enterococcus dongliensis]MDT2638365.1 hypothetical protein [Enterococcus dongliensis]MDT2643632.1 hypothetical protein [Enterococcus dongliensis]MDT2677742.1 hypothetical protein [Enterococcus dongliensis]